MTRYRKKPVVIDAVQWTGTNQGEVMTRTGTAQGHHDRPDAGRWGVNHDRPRTIAQAEASGYTVDTHTNPPTAYKGPRFDPVEAFPLVGGIAAPNPYALYVKSCEEHPRGSARQVGLYRALCIEHGVVTGSIEDMLLSLEEKAQLRADLAEMARQRRRSEAASANWSMP